MKHAVRVTILLFGLVGTYVATAAPQVPAPDGGPILTCPPGAKCPKGTGLPPLVK
jgi:hypothetical protein